MKKKQDLLNVVKPTRNEVNELVGLRDEVNKLKIALAEAFIRSQQLTIDVATAQQNLHAKAVEVARAHDINVDDPAAGLWNLDTDCMQFVRVNS